MYRFFGISKIKSSKGFTLPELMIVIAIIGVLAAIAVPSALNQRVRAIEASMQADILGVSSSTDLLLTTWRGTPPAEVSLSTTEDGDWSAVVEGQPENVGSGVVSTGNVLSGTIWTDGSYCLSITNPVADSTIIYRSDDRNPVLGTCPTSALGGIGSLPGTTPVVLPDMPGSLSAVSPSNNTIDVTWTEVTDATSYTVSIAGIASQEVIAPLLTATFIEVPPGTLTVVVYAQNDNGAGPGSYASVAVAGEIAYALSTRLNTYTYTVVNQAAKNTIAGQTPGSTVWIAETAWSETWNGSSWIVTGGTTPFASISRNVDLVLPDDTIVNFTGDISNGMTGFTESDGVFTAVRSGKYNISFSIVFGQINNIGVREAYVLLNDTTNILLSNSAATTNFDSHLAASRTISLSEGDTIALKLYQSSSSDLSLLASSGIPAYFDVSYVSP
jgi:prepilin-type N-terminal cleavage/methylation domain-containing protein